MGYLRDLTMPNEALKIVIEEYVQAIDRAQNRVDRFKAHLKSLLENWEWKPVVKALMACKGFQEVAAMTIISELGDLRRFAHPRQLMAFVGLVPSEHSSGGSRRQGSITKCGNTHARWMLVEAAQHARRTPKVSGELTRRQQGQSNQVKELSWRMQNRLHKKYVRLRIRGKQESKCIVAVAREMLGFIWELQNKCGINMPQPATNTFKND
jgi:transposase